MAKSNILFGFSSLIMAAIFAYSASVQLNDPDWFFWFPLYASACAVNMGNLAKSSKAIIKQTARVTLWLGIFLFFKVVIEDFVMGKAGFWSLNLSERVAREKIGSGLVIISLILQLEKLKSEISRKGGGRNNKEIPRFVEYGMAFLVIFSLGHPFIFFVVRNGEMKFD